MSEFTCPDCGDVLVDYYDGDFYCEGCDEVFQRYELDADDDRGLDFIEDWEECD